MVIYLDQVLVLNGLLDYLLLVACGRVTASPLRRKRLLLGALLGGGYALLCLMPGLSFLGNLWWSLPMAGGMCRVAFGPGRGLIRRSVVLALLGAAFSGVVLVLTELMSAPAALVARRVYYPVSFGTLVLTAGGALGVMKWGLGRLTHQGGDIVPVRITLGGRAVELTALRDTGNCLRDPVSGCPVLVADGAVLKRLLPEASITPEALARPGELLCRIPMAHPRLIPYRTVGVARGLLLAIRPERLEVKGKEEEMLVAFSPVPVSDGGGYQALLGGEI